MLVAADCAVFLPLLLLPLTVVCFIGLDARLASIAVVCCRPLLLLTPVVVRLNKSQSKLLMLVAVSALSYY